MKTLITISGPTASGKTKLSIDLAKHFGAEIVSADSRQFYKHLTIGTAKATKSELEQVKHHFIDILEPYEPYNAGQFEDDVIPFLSKYFLTNDIAIMVGGSGLYINAIKHGFDPLPKSSAETRSKWSGIRESKGLPYLRSELKKLDPLFYAKVDLNNYQRVQRALEVIDETGKPFSELRTKKKKVRDFNCFEIQILPEREVLYTRINQRVDVMLAEGLLKEVESLTQFKGLNALQTVGYSELFQFLNKELSLEEAIIKIKQHTRNFAKRQFTWFKKHSGDLILQEPKVDIALKHLKERISV